MVAAVKSSAKSSAQHIVLRYGFLGGAPGTETSKNKIPYSRCLTQESPLFNTHPYPCAT